MKALLHLPESFRTDDNKSKSNAIVVAIDLTSFHFYGHVHDYSDGKEDDSISFRLHDITKSESVLQHLRDNFRYNVDKAKYIRLRTSFETWESDTRPLFWLRLPSGMKGLMNPSEFHFANPHGFRVKRYHDEKISSDSGLIYDSLDEAEKGYKHHCEMDASLSHYQVEYYQ